MPFHPTEARWFEVRVPRNQTVYALEALARTGAVELEEKSPETGACVDSARLRKTLARFDLLAKRYEQELPRDELPPPGLIEDPEQIAEEAVAYLRSWCIDLLGVKRRLRTAERQRGHLALLAECLTSMQEESEGLDAFGHSTGFLYKRIFACAKGGISDPATKESVIRVYEGQSHDFWVVAGVPEHAKLVDTAATLFACTPVRIPEWLPQDWRAQRQQVGKHLRDLDREIGEAETALAAHRADRGIREALANARILRWYLDISLGPTTDHRACHLAGWTIATDPAVLQRALEDAHIDATVVFGKHRIFQHPPVSLTTSPWTRPFQLFVKMLGTPGRDEVDPTPILAVIVPLLFGFMFPDLGHGLILALGGLVLSRRIPEAMILVPCGLASAGFGIAFGEVFGLHDVIPSALGCPLEHPLAVVGVSLVFGAGLILMGLVFSGMEAFWRGETGRWALEEAPLLALYISALFALANPYALAVAAAAILWYVAGIAVLCRGNGLRCVAARAGRFVESTLQLAIHTLSFLRVGAFALAHAAFSVVVLELVAGVDNSVLQALVFVIGHATIIVLEGLVVFVQTTRLVLFEFFIRFLRFEGRIYKPLQAPPPRHTL